MSEPSPPRFGASGSNSTALRANKVILALTAITGAVIAGALAATATDPTLTASELFIYPLPLVAMLASVVGILMFTGEAQHGTLAVALVARPARWVIVVAKTIMATTVGLALGTTGMIAGFAGAVAGRRPARHRFGPDLPGAVGPALHRPGRPDRPRRGHDRPSHRRRHHRALAVVVRHREPVRPGHPQGVRHFLPFSAGYRLLDAGPNFEAPVAIADLLGRPQYALIFGGYALISLTIGTLLLYRRDSN